MTKGQYKRLAIYNASMLDCACVTQTNALTFKTNHPLQTNSTVLIC